MKASKEKSIPLKLKDFSKPKFRITLIYLLFPRDFIAEEELIQLPSVSDLKGFFLEDPTSTIMRCKHQLPVGCHGEGTSSEAGIDRFSDLPEEVAHHILSFVDFKYPIRITTKNKPKHLASLMSSFDGYLHFRGHNRMQRIRIHLSFSTSKNEKKYCDDYSRLLLKWIHNAVRCNVEHLDLNFDHCVTSTFSLPSFILHSQSLRSLLVSLGIINSDVVEGPSLSFSSNLRYLSLCYVKIVDESLFKWISWCCKYLKELHLRSVKGIQDISVESSSLESFPFINHGDVHLSISCEKLENI
ncbi:hypothetical protein DVH24_014321 [Malus domestica]|uniref:F-box/LRR-repeat protein 15/At3g58940/PEG3-like LRR domain-containing protein n=1 Tax=Malus domestica TaxID=3750 RepID=A0A498JFW8_MALDO|nr:hypothetical protein DVH24_014321 [Malus domestica]